MSTHVIESQMKVIQKLRAFKKINEFIKRDEGKMIISHFISEKFKKRFLEFKKIKPII